MKKYFFAFVILFFISSCNYLQEKSTPHIKTLHTTGKNRITTVAILPFTNKSEKKGSEEVLRKCFFTNLSIKGYDLLKLEEIDERLHLASIDASNLDKEDVYKIGRIVKADALIYGTVTRCCKKHFGLYSQVTFGAEEIRKSNKDVSDVTLKAGQELVIPDMPILKDIGESQTIARNRHKKTVYRAKWGYSFYEIATKVFDDGKRWTIVYDANKHEIKDMRDIPVGQVIIVPLTISKQIHLNEINVIFIAKQTNMNLIA